MNKSNTAVLCGAALIGGAVLTVSIAGHRFAAAQEDDETARTEDSQETRNVPPNHADVEDFHDNKSADAFDVLVQGLPDRPEYGERT